MSRQKHRKLNFKLKNNSKKSNKNVHTCCIKIIEFETKRLEAKIKAESDAEVNRIEMEKQIL